MYFLYSGCMNRRSTRTITVLSHLSLTTVPCMTRLGMASSSDRARRLRGEDGLDARDIATHFAYARRVLELPGGPLEAQVELLLLELQQLLAQLILGPGAQLRRLHHGASPCGRPTKRVRNGSLAPPRRIASWASVAETPSISNMIRAALTGATQYSTEPLPLPMRTSAGFLLPGTSGKMPIHTRPARFRWRVIARRAASIWRAVTRALPVAFMPKAPKLSSAPALVRPSLRPLWRLRYLVRLGCIMAQRSLSCAPTSFRSAAGHAQSGRARGSRP